MAALVGTHERDLNCLSDANKTTRSRAIKRLEKALFKSSDREGAQLYFRETLLPLLLELFADRVEKCREGAITFVARWATEACEPNVAAELLARVVPCIRDRFAKAEGGGSGSGLASAAANGFAEECEELRLQLVQLLESFVKLEGFGAVAHVCLDDVATAAVRASADAFHAVKKCAALVVSRLAKACPEHVHLHLEPLARAMLANLRHQHQRVRRASIDAIGALVCCGADGLEKLLTEDVLPAFLALRFDSSGSVRKTSAKTIAKWLHAEALRGLSAECEARIVYVLLGSAVDESPDVARVALAGFLGESDAGSDAASAAAAWESPPAELHARFCRLRPELVALLLGEVGEWLVPTRLLASKALVLFVHAIKADATASLTELLNGICHGCIDEDADVVAACYAAAHAMTRHVRIDALVAALVPLTLAGEVGARRSSALIALAAILEGGWRQTERPVEPYVVVQTRAGPFSDMAVEDLPPHAAAAAAAEAKQRAAAAAAAPPPLPPSASFDDHLLRVAETLCEPSLSDSDDAQVQREVLRVIVTIVRVAAAGRLAPLPLGAPLQLALLRALLQLHAHTGRTGGDGGANIVELGSLGAASDTELAASLLAQIDATIAALATVSLSAEESACDDISDVDVLFGAHMDSLLPLSMEGHATWTNASPRRYLFDSLLRHCCADASSTSASLRQGALSRHMPQLVELFCSVCATSRDADLRLAMLALLDTMLHAVDPAASGEKVRGTPSSALAQALSESAPRLLTDAMVPNAIWRVGRVESAVRKLGIACIATLLQTNVVEKEPLVRILPSLQPPIVSGLDEDYEETTRYLSCIALASLFRKISPHADGVFFVSSSFVMLDATTLLPGASSLPSQSTGELVHKLYPALLKPLDDSSDKVRRTVCMTLRAFFMLSDNRAYSQTCMEYSMGVLFIHLDDAEMSMRIAVASVLEAFIELCPQELLDLATAAREKHRFPDICDRLIELTRAKLEQ